MDKEKGKLDDLKRQLSNLEFSNRSVTIVGGILFVLLILDTWLR